MPITTRSRVPVAVPQPKSTSTERKKNPSQSRSVKNKPEEKPLSNNESSEDDVPLAKVKAKQSKPAAKAPAKTEAATASKAGTKRTAVVAPLGKRDRNNVNHDKSFLLPDNLNQTYVHPGSRNAESVSGLSNEDDQELVNEENSESEEIYDDSPEAPALPVQSKIQVKPLKVGEESDYEDADTVSERVMISKRGRKNKPVSSDEVEVAEVTSDLRSQDEELEPANPSSKSKKGKQGATKKTESKKVPLDPVSDSNALEVASKSTKQGGKTNKAPTDKRERTQVASDDDLPKVVPKTTKRGTKKVDSHVVSDEQEFAKSDSSPEIVRKPATRGARKKDIPTANIEPMEAASDDDTSEVPPKPAKRGTKKQTKKAQNKEEESKAEAMLPELMDQLNLNQDAMPTKGGKKNTRAKSAKPAAKNYRKKKAVDSDSETIIAKYSSTESLKNITLRPKMVKSYSEDNLAGSSLIKSRRGAAANNYVPSEEEEEVEEPVVRKTKGSRKKAAK